MNNPNEKSVTQSVDRSKLPLLFCCSGAIGPAQLGNYIANKLDRSYQVEWSNILGVNAGVPELVEKVKSGRPIIVMDGCEQGCVKHALSKLGVTPVVWHQMTESYESAKDFHADSDKALAEKALAEIAKTVPHMPA